MTNKNDFFEKYNNGTHVLGRIVTLIALTLFFAVPFIMGLFLGAMPDMNGFFKGFLAVGIVYFISAVAEYFIYVPILGSGGAYLAFITGNLINMKIPCAMNARDIVGVKSGTEEGEIINTLSISTSSLVNILVLALGVMMLVPLTPVLQNPVLTPAFDNVVPALFGAMAYKYYRKGYKIAWIPLLAMTILFILVPSLMGSVSFMIIPSGALAILVAYKQWQKEV